jgi:ABC-type phosphate transport system substrate-binding protein
VRGAASNRRPYRDRSDLAELIRTHCVSFDLDPNLASDIGRATSDAVEARILLDAIDGCKGISLRVAGSDTMGAALVPASAVAFLRFEQASDIKTVADLSADRVTIEGYIGGIRHRIIIEAKGSHAGFIALGDGDADLVMSSEQIDDRTAEKLKMQNKGDLRGETSEYPIALDALVVIANRLNPVEDMQIETLKRVFLGEIRHWHEILDRQLIEEASSAPHVKQPTDEILVYSRTEESGTYAEFVRRLGLKTGTFAYDKLGLIP